MNASDDERPRVTGSAYLDSWRIEARRFELAPLIFQNGFEPGDLSAWN